MISTAPAIPKTYAELRRQVQETLLLGQRRIEQARVETYWKTGRLIHEHIMSRASRPERYGHEVIENLSKDLKINSSVLWRCLRFARSFQKILAARPESLPDNLTWTHYRTLITVPDDETRLSFMRRAAQKGWTTDELAEKIRLEVRPDNGHPRPGAADRARPVPKLTPKRGRLYTYRLAAPAEGELKEDTRPWIDLGFQVHRRLPDNAPKLKPEDIIESVWKDTGGGSGSGEYAAVRSPRTEADLFTYKAVIERIVDGDTLLVRIDLGFETRVRQYLRLRGIDCPEMATEEGKRAKRFVERELAAVPFIILTSSRADKYDRYLADVYYGRDAGAGGGGDTGAGRGTNAGEIYLNQKLLDEGLAGRMG